VSNLADKTTEKDNKVGRFHYTATPTRYKSSTINELTASVRRSRSHPNAAAADAMTTQQQLHHSNNSGCGRSVQRRERRRRKSRRGTVLAAVINGV